MGVWVSGPGCSQSPGETDKELDKVQGGLCFGGEMPGLWECRRGGGQVVEALAEIRKASQRKCGRPKIDSTQPRTAWGMLMTQKDQSLPDKWRERPERRASSDGSGTSWPHEGV